MAKRSTPTKEYKDFSLEIHKQAGDNGKPFKATMELTYGCNLYCIHCYTDCYNQPDLIKRRELPYEQITGILDQLHDEGILWLCFTGGEILMRRDFFDIYRYAEAKGFLITLFTNATLITHRVADFLAEHRPFLIETSLHGATPETFEKITQVKGSFRRFEEGIRLLLARNLPVKVKTKAMTQNKHELDQIKAFVEGLGLKFQVSTDIYPRLNGELRPTRYRLSPDEIVELEFSDTDFEDENDTCPIGEDAEFGPPPDDRLFRCGCGTTSVHISAWGELGACTWVNQPRTDLRQKSVSDGIAEVFPHIRSARYQTGTPCRSCQIHSLCDKMPANAATEAGDREQPVEHFCRLAHTRASRMGVLAERGQIIGRKEL